jgi:hypothetical protein
MASGYWTTPSAPLCVCVCVCVHRACYSAQWNYEHICGTTSLASCRICSKRKRVGHLLTAVTNVNSEFNKLGNV